MSGSEVLKLNPLLSDRVRLAVMATLASADEPMEFMILIENLELTKGNLSSHIQKLEEAGLVEVKKEFVGKKPRTSFICTPLGKKEIQNYLNQIEKILRQTKK
jgi:DNA-binding transcriptional ArsR family regulator